MRRIRALIIVSAVGVATLGSVLFGAAPAQATVNGFMTCHINLLSDGSGSGGSQKPIECYY
jgi:hypothetical protein